MKRLFFAMVIMFSIATSAVAEYRETCFVSYLQYDEFGSQQWSQEYKMNVTFLSGNELNKKTKSFNFNVISTYALLWFSQNQVAIVELNCTGLGIKFTKMNFNFCFGPSYGSSLGTQVNSNAPRQWRIVYNATALY